MATNGQAPPDPTPPAGEETSATQPKPVMTPEVIEFLVVMGFAFVPSLIVSMAFWLMPTPVERPTGLLAYQYVLKIFEMCLPLLYIVWRNDGSWKSLGLVKPKWSDIFWGILLFLSAYLAYYAVAIAFRALLPQPPVHEESWRAALPHLRSAWDYPGILCLSLAVGFGEELLFRGFIISRWHRLSGSVGQAIAVSALLFGINHVYQGAMGILSAAILGCVYAAGFSKLRRLWPTAIAHAMTDFIALSLQ